MKYMKGYRFRAILGIIFKFIESVFELMLPLIMVKLIDEGINYGDMALIKKLVLLMGLMSIFGYLSSLVCQYNASVVSQGMGGKLRTSLMEKIGQFSLVELDKIGSSTLVNRMILDINQVQLMVAMIIRQAVRAPILMAGSIFALTKLNQQIGNKLLMFLPLFIITIVFFMWLSLIFFRKMQTHLDKLMAKLSEFLDGIRIIRAFSRVEDEIEMLDDANQDLGKSMKMHGFVTTLSSPFTMLLMNLIMVLLIYEGALQVDQGIMTQGQMVAVINYSTQLVMALVVFMNLVTIYSRGFSSSFRLKEVLNVEPAVQNAKNPVTELGDDLTIRFENVSFSYPGERRKVISNLSFMVKPGEMVGFIGLTGSGKSTLMQLLMRYYDVQEGNIYLNDIDIRDIDINVLRNRIGFATQTSDFMTETLMENIAMSRDVDVEKALGMAEGNEILEKGLESLVLTGGKNLSGGQRQRVNIARALANDPSILILDDSLSALDYLTDKNLRGNLEKHYKYMSTLVITQRTTSLVHADTIYVLVDGRIQDAGNHELLLSRNKLYSEIHATQAKEETE